MAITALQGLLKTMCTALGQPRLLGKLAHALCARFTKRLENPQTFLPKSHVGLVLQRVAELSPAFSSSAYLTDTQLSRLKRVPAHRSRLENETRPSDWTQLRDRWEYAHVARAGGSMRT